MKLKPKTKHCKQCHRPIIHDEKKSVNEYLSRIYCSVPCANRARTYDNSKRGTRKRDLIRASRQNEKLEIGKRFVKTTPFEKFLYNPWGQRDEKGAHE